MFITGKQQFWFEHANAARLQRRDGDANQVGELHPLPQVGLHPLLQVELHLLPQFKLTQ